jgi:hypothetical protein
MISDSKLAPNFAWLFVLVTLGVTIVAIVASIGGAISGTKVRGSIGQVAALRKA